MLRLVKVQKCFAVLMLLLYFLLFVPKCCSKVKIFSVFLNPSDLLRRVYPDVGTCWQKRNGREGNSHFHGG